MGDHTGVRWATWSHGWLAQLGWVLLTTPAWACTDGASQSPLDAAVSAAPTPPGSDLLGHCYVDDPSDMGQPEGLFHGNGIDAVNLGIHADGSFDYSIFGCDFGGGETGRWEADGDAIVLLPAAGLCSLELPGLGTVSCARATADGQGGLVLSGRSRGEAMRYTMASGGVCAVCGTNLGPSEMPRPCEVVFDDLDAWRGQNESGYCDPTDPPKVSIHLDPAGELEGGWYAEEELVSITLMVMPDFPSVVWDELTRGLVPIVRSLEILGADGQVVLSGIDTLVDEEPRRAGEFQLDRQNRDAFHISIWAGADGTGPAPIGAGEYILRFEVRDNPFVRDLEVQEVKLVLY